MNYFQRCIVLKTIDFDTIQQNFPRDIRPTVAKSDELSNPYRRARIRRSPGETLPNTLMAPGACM